MPVYSVLQVTTYVKEVLEREDLLQDLWVRGEVANLARPASGHSYFSLRDVESSLRCVMFRAAHGADRLANGEAVIAHGRVSVYQVRGELQMIVDLVQPEGMGELQLRLEQLKLKLETEGLFEPSRKRPLPAFPRRIGVVTSPTGAVWSDIQTVIARRYPLVELLLAPAAVQGDSAAPSIVEAFQALNGVPDLDVAILARGGGSLEDLWPFNEESVARAVYASRAPVVSAVGHETDVTISDLVADRRAPTPSAAAEMVVPDRQDLAAKLIVAEQALLSSVRGHRALKAQLLAARRDRLLKLRPDLDSQRMHVDDLLQQAAASLSHALALHGERVVGLSHRLSSLSPLDTLRRGYAVVQRREDGAVVSDSAHVEAGDDVDVTLTRGGFAATVISTRPKAGDAAPLAVRGAATSERA